MAVRQFFITLVVVLTLARIDRRRAKAAMRAFAVRICHRLLSWLSQPYRLRTEPCIVFAPHQDDETLGCGALIARKRNEGLSVHVVFITDGSASHPGHPRLSSSDITALRRREAHEALGILGVETPSIHFLDEPDGTLHHLTPSRQTRLIAELSVLLADIRPSEIFLPCSPDGSSEHDAAFGFVCAALQKVRQRPDIWQYPVWSWWNPLLLLQRLVVNTGRCAVPTEDYRPIKARALARYRSQIEPTSPWPEAALPPELVRVFNSDQEFFFRFDLPPSGIEHAPVTVI